jgi:hypothetical protein
VGTVIARNAWPARIGRDGTLHVNTADSVWAFELGQRAAEIAARLEVPALRFVPGPLPRPESDEAKESRPPLQEASPEQASAAAAIAAPIADEKLRETVQKAVLSGLRRQATGRPLW